MKVLHVGVREVARRARLDPSFLSKVLAGIRSAPSNTRIERLAKALEMSETALFIHAGRIPPSHQALFESPQMLASLERGRMMPPATPVARPSGRDDSRAKARATSSLAARPVESRNAWASARPEKPRAVRGPASGTPSDISDDLL